MDNALPPEFLILIVAVASALTGGLLTWLVGYFGRGEQRALSPNQDDEQALLSVSRTRRGKLAVLVQGHHYRRLQEIKDPEEGRQAIEALKVVLAFAEGWLPALQQRPAQPDSAAPGVTEEAFLEQLRQTELFAPERSPGLLGQLSQPKSKVKAFRTPAEQIDDLVQERLDERPELAKQKIRLTTGQDGGLRIHVGLQTYSAIPAIPDPEIRALIRNAIREWESQ